MGFVFNEIKMDRRHFIFNSTLSFAFYSIISSCKSHKMLPIQSIMEGPYTFIEINRGVGYFVGRGGTIGWSVSKNEVSIVDTQFPEQITQLLSELDKYNPDGKIDVLINTHHHVDHTSGNIILKDRVIQHVAHENTISNYRRVTAEQESQDKALYPTTSFKDKTHYQVGDEDLHLFHLGPAHTNGDAIVLYEKANVVHLGDLIFNRRFPYIDKSSGANIQSWVGVLDQVTTMFDDKASFIFGHKGEGYTVTGNKNDINAFKNYLEKVLELGNKSIKAGMSLDELKATITYIPGAEEWKGEGIERSLEAVYKELQNK